MPDITSLHYSRGLVIAGLILMVIGAVDPLEGSVVIVGGSLLVAAGAHLRHARSRLPFTALILIVVGVGAMFGLTALGGVGGNTGRSLWWLVLCVPYAIGWMLGLIAAATLLRAPRDATV